VLADIVYDGDTRMLQPSGEPRLPLKAVSEFGSRDPLPDHLHSDLSIKGPVLGAPHFTDVAVTEELLKDIASGELRPPLHSRPPSNASDVAIP
jgi:hypothetical protein